MTPSNCTVEELDAHLRKLVAGEDRSVVLIDGYTSAGKTSLATRLAQIPGVAWTPAYLFEADDGLDLRKMKKDLLKPFRKEGRVRELVPAMSGSGLQRGRPQSGIKVLIIEGIGVALSSKSIKADQVCWLECDRDRRLERTACINPAASVAEIEALFDRHESSDLRSTALQFTDLIVDTNKTEPPIERSTPNGTVAPVAQTSALLNTDAESFAARIGVDPNMITAELDAPINGSAPAPASEPEADLLPGWLGDD